MAFVYCGNMVFVQEHNNNFDYVDHVDLSKSPVFSNLLRYIGWIFGGKIGLLWYHSGTKKTGKFPGFTV